MTEVRAGVIGGQGRKPLHVVAVILRDGHAFLEARDGTQEDGLLAGGADGEIAQVFDALGRGRGHLHLDLEGDAGLGVGPVVGQDEAAGAGGFDDGTRGVGHTDTHEAGLLAVDVHFERRGVDGLGELEVAEFRDLGEFGAHGFGVGAIVCERRAADGDLDRGRRTEAHHAAHDVRGLEGETDVRQGGAEATAQVFLGGIKVDLGVGLELDLQGGFVGAAVPGMDEVDGIIGGVHADEAEGGADVLRAEFLLDDVQGAQGDLFGLVELGPGGGAQADLQLAVIGRREDLASELGSEDSDERRGERDPAEHDDGFAREHAVQDGLIAGFDLGEEARGVRAFVLEQPDGEDGQQGRREGVGGDHAEADREGEGEEERLGGAFHEQRGQEDGHDARHREEAGAGGGGDGVAHGPGDGTTFFALLLDGFDGDGGFVHEDADRQGEAAQGHEVDGLAAEPEAEQGDEQGERDVDDDYKRAAGVAQEEEDHEAGQGGAEHGFEEEVMDGPLDDRALVHLVADLDVGRDGVLEGAEVAFDDLRHGQRRGVGALGDGDVDGATSVHEGVAGHGVRAVHDLRDVADEHGRILARTHEDVLEVLDVLHRGVDGHEEVLVAEDEITGGQDGVGSGERGGDFLRRDAGAAEPVGVEVDEDGTGAAAEGRGSGDAGQGGEERADGVQRGVLQLRDGTGLAREHELADRHAAGVEPHDERRHGTGRHHGARTVHVTDGLAHGLRHVRPRVELELHHRGALDVLRFDVLNAGDVQEVVFVIEGEEAFHLRGVHAAERLGDVDRRDVQGREDVLGHAVQAEDGRQDQRDDRDDQGDRPAKDHGKEAHERGLQREPYFLLKVSIPIPARL